VPNFACSSFDLSSPDFSIASSLLRLKGLPTLGGEEFLLLMYASPFVLASMRDASMREEKELRDAVSFED
jgi:hypothetical protein